MDHLGGSAADEVALADEGDAVEPAQTTGGVTDAPSNGDPSLQPELQQEKQEAAEGEPESSTAPRPDALSPSPREATQPAGLLDQTCPAICKTDGDSGSCGQPATASSPAEAQPDIAGPPELEALLAGASQVAEPNREGPAEQEAGSESSRAAPGEALDGETSMLPAADAAEAATVGTTAGGAIGADAFQEGVSIPPLPADGCAVPRAVQPVGESLEMGGGEAGLPAPATKADQDQQAAATTKSSQPEQLSNEQEASGTVAALSVF
jgi:hypothetical protein